METNDDLRILIQATFDKNQIIQDANNVINSISGKKNLSELKLKLTLDKNSLKSQMKDLLKEMQVAFNTDSSGDMYTKKLVQREKDAQRRILAIKQDTIRIQNQYEAESLRNNINRNKQTMTKNTYADLRQTQTGMRTTTDVTELKHLKAMAKLQLEQANETKREYTSMVKDIDGFTKQAEKSINRLTTDTSGLKKELKELQELAQKLKSADVHDDKYNQIKSEYKTKYLDTKDNFKEKINQAEITNATKLNMLKEHQLQTEKEILNNRINLYRQNNKQNLTSEQTDKLNNIQNNIELADAKGLNNIKKQVQAVTGEFKLADVQSQTFFGNIKEKAIKFTQWFTITQTIMFFVKTVKSIVTEVRAIDTAMTDLKKVTNETDATYTRFLKNATTTAKELKTSIGDIIQTTSTWAKLGYDIPDAETNAKATVVLANVGDMDIDSATNAMIAGLKAYGDGLDGAMDLTDKYNEVGNKFAISSDGIAEAMRLSASALKLAGNSIDEGIAIITAGNNIIQDPNAVGTFAKTMTMRLRGASSVPKTLRDELASMGEDMDDFEESVTQVQAKMKMFTQNRVDIMVDENTFKSTYQILKDINSVWDDLTDKDRADVVELIGGKRGGSIATSMIESMDEAEQVKEASLNSFGSAMEEQRRWAESIDGHIGDMKANWQEFSAMSIDSTIIKSGIDLVTILLQLGTTMGGLVPIATTFGLIIAAYKFKPMTEMLFGLISTLWKYTSGVSAANQMTMMFTASQKAMYSSLAGVGIALGVWAVVKALDAAIVTSSEQAEIVQDIKAKYDETTSAVQKYSDELEKSKMRVKELNDLKLNGGITSQQEEELSLLQQQNIELSNQLEIEKQLEEYRKRELSKETETLLTKKDDVRLPNQVSSSRLNPIDRFNTELKAYEDLTQEIVNKQSILASTPLTKNKDIERQSQEIKDLIELQQEYQGMISISRKELGESYNNLNEDSEFKSILETEVIQKYDAFLESVKHISPEVENLGSKVSETKEEIKALGEQFEELTTRQDDLSKYIDEYNENSKLSNESVMEMIQKYPDMVKFLNQSKDGYVLNTRALEHLNKVTERQKYLLDEYIKSQQNNMGINRDYLENSNSMLDGILEEHSYKLNLDVSDSNYRLQDEIDSNLIDTDIITELVGKIKELNSNLIEGSITNKEYFQGLQESMNSIDFGNLDENTDLQAIFSNMAGNISSGVADVMNAFNNGMIGIDEYTDSLNVANDTMLKHYTIANNLEKNISGQWIDSSGQVDDYANSIEVANRELYAMNDIVELLEKNSKYLSENMTVMGEANFDLGDEKTSQFKQFASEYESMLNDLYYSSNDTFNKIVDGIVNTTNQTKDQILNADGMLKEGLLQSSENMNAAIDVSNATIGESISDVLGATGDMISKFGDMISGFDYQITIKPQVGSTGKLSGMDFIQGLFTGAIPPMTIDFKGSGSNSSAVTAFANSVKAVGESIKSAADTTIDLSDYLNKNNRVSPTATPKPKKSSSGSGSDAQKEIDKIDEYEKAIKRLDLAISQLQYDREKLIEGSDAYNQSLKEEIRLTKEKENLTKAELERVNKNLKKYDNLKEPSSKASNKTIESYNKKLKEKTELEDKSIELQKTITDLYSKQEELLRKQADIIAESSNKKIDAIEREIAIIEARQKLMESDTKDYFDFQKDKIDLLIEKQKQYQLDVIKTQSLLDMATINGYSGNQIEKWQADLKESEKMFYEMEYDIREARKSQRLDEIKRKVEEIGLITEGFNNILSDFDGKLGLLANDDYINKLDTLSSALKYAQFSVNGLGQAYADLRNIQPQTKEEAEQLASEMSNLTKQYFEAKKSAIEYKRQMDIMMVDQLSSKFQSDMDKLNSMISLFSHNITMLDGGQLDGTDIDFNIGILPDIPQSNYDKERAEIDALYAEKQKYEEEILELRRRSFTEQAEMRDAFNNETLGQTIDFNNATQEEMTNSYDEIVRILAQGMGIELDTMDEGHKNILNIIKASLFETKQIYDMTWQEIVTNVTQALSTISQATIDTAQYAYANFSSDGKYLGTTYGESGKSNHLSNAGYIITESGTRYDVNKNKVIPKYADGTDGHQGGVALIAEYDREEMVIFPDGTTKVFRNASLVDLPKGSQVIPHEETKDIKRYVGNEFDNGKIPKYASGIGSLVSSVVKSVVKKAVETIYDREAAWYAKQAEQKQTIQHGIVSYHDGLGNTDTYRQGSAKSINNALSQIGNNHYQANQGMNSTNDSWMNTKNFSLPAGTKLTDGNGVTVTYVPSYTYTDLQGRTMTTSATLAQAMMNNIKSSGGDLSKYNFQASDKTIKSYDLENTARAYEYAQREKQGRYNEIPVYAKQQLESLQNQVQFVNGFNGGFNYSYGNQDYYNRQNKTEHDKQLDKIRFENFISKDMVSSFNAYKKDRDVIQEAIKSEQEAIKQHFSDGGIRQTVEDRINALIEQIDEQTRKDVDMQFKLTEDVLKKQRDLAKEYMTKTEDAYTKGINDGLSTDALKKLRDEYAEAREEHQRLEEAIKSNVKSRFDYEFALMDKRQQKYLEYQNDILFQMDVLNTVTNSKDFSQQTKLNESLVASYTEQLKSLLGEYSELEKKQNEFSVGSYEWNLYEAQLKKVKTETQDINKQIASIIDKNKQLGKSQLEEVFKNINKETENILFDGKSQKEAQREITKERDEYNKYITGVEKEYSLDLLMRDLRKEKISDFDTELRQMQESDKLNRDELETLQKKVNIKKLEIALEKARDDKNIRSLQKDEDGNWDFKWVEDENLVKDLEDKLTQAQIDMQKWNKDLEFKTVDLTMKEKLEFMDRLQEIQQKALNSEYKNTDEFIDELNKLGLTMKEYEDWANQVQDKILDDSGNSDSIFNSMKDSFTSYTEVINDMNTRLEALLLALSIDKTINLNDAYNNNTSYVKIGEQSEKFITDINGVPTATTPMGDSIDYNNETMKQFLEMIKESTLSLNMSKVVNGLTNTQANGGSNDIVHHYNFENLTLPNVTDYESFMNALSNIDVYTKK